MQICYRSKEKAETVQYHYKSKECEEISYLIALLFASSDSCSEQEHGDKHYHPVGFVENLL
jgi:hypothetical protein